MHIVTTARGFIISVIFIVFSAQAFPQQFLYNADKYDFNNDKIISFRESQEAFYDYWDGREIKSGQGWKQFKRYEYFWEQRLFGKDTFPNAVKIYNEMQSFVEKQQNFDSPLMEAEWIELGPSVVPKNQLYYESSGLGRVSCIRFHPTDENTFWVGAATGGIWKTTDFGQSWKTHPFTQFLSIGISDIAVFPKNPDIVYAATGDVNYYYGSGNYSIGVIKSTDGGGSWEITSLNKSMSHQHLVSRLLVHPDNGDVVIAAARDGIYKTTDGGENWYSVSSSFFARDMEFKPGNPEVMYVSTYNRNGNISILKSTDTGEKWNIVKSFSNANRIVLEVTPDAPENVYALVSEASSNGFGGFYVSVNEGKDWQRVSYSPNILGRDGNGGDQGGQGNYDLAAAVNPFDKDEIYAGGINLWKSVNGGSTWKLNGHWTGSYGVDYLHADQHDLIFNPLNGFIFAGNDGGIYYSTDEGKNWTDITNGMSIMQFYRLACSEEDSKVVFGGSQDNGTQKRDIPGWFHVRGGDGMECLVDYSDKNTVYCSLYNGDIYKSKDGGNNFSSFFNSSDANEYGSWVTPYVIDPENPGIIHIGYRNVWKVNGSRNNAEKISNFGSSYSLNALAVSSKNPDYIYASSRSTLWRTTNGGEEWENIYTSSSYITYISVDTEDPSHIWISQSGYNPDDKVIEIIDKNPVNITGSLPNVPVNCVIHQKNSPGRVFIGTDIGVFYRDEETGGWVSFSKGLPNVIVNELEIHYPSGKLRAATFGRGLWETKIINCDIETPELTIKGELEFCEGDSVILQAPDGYYRYEWSTGETGSSITVKKSGTYNLTVYDQQGCRARSEEIKVRSNYVPELVINPIGDYPVCVGDSVKLMVGFGFKDLTWNTGSGGRMIWIKEPGIYRIYGFTADGCRGESEPFSAEFYPVPEKPVISQYRSTLTAPPAEKHIWYSDGEVIEDAEGRYFNVEEYGNYSVEIFNEYGCSSMSNPFDVISSIEEEAEGIIFSLTPNPAYDLISLRYENKFYTNSSLLITIRDVLGQTKWEREFTHNIGFISREIDISLLSTGIYYMTVTNESRHYVLKFVKI